VSIAVAVLACVIAAAAQVDRGAGQLYVTDTAAALVSEGLAQRASEVGGTGAFQEVPAPSLRNVPNSGYAQVTLAPWVESNGWRFQRGVTKANYATLPRGTAPLAAAEAFAYGVDAILNADAEDVQELGSLLRFLKAHPQPGDSRLGPLANIGIVDDGSLEAGEALNMLTRRNLLYRIVSQPDKTVDLNIQIGGRDFPKQSLANPSDFAARVREKLGDDRRLVRVYGTNTAIARLTGDGQRMRFILLSYSRNRLQQDVRIRLLGRHQPAAFAAFGAAPDAKLVDIEHVGPATEFSLPSFSTIAIVDLTK
jgi:hypothetical protein